jgi:hypothetical protein
MFEAPRPLPEPAAAPVAFGGQAVRGRPFPWSWAVDRLVSSRNYWLSATSVSGAPDVRPVWGVWDPAGLYVATYSVISKDIDAGSEVTVTLEDAERVVILRTRAFRISDVDLLTDVVARYAAKYGTAPTVDPRGLISYDGMAMPAYLLVPHRALGWTDAERDRSTKWHFDG